MTMPKKTTISVTQSSANAIIQAKLNPQKEYKFQEIKDVLVESFLGVNDNQCAGLIHRAHSKTDGVLTKKDKYYKLRSTAIAPGNEDGLYKAKNVLKDALREIEQIPISHFKTVKQFNELIQLKEHITRLTN